jgi:hypothetical protein
MMYAHGEITTGSGIIGVCDRLNRSIDDSWGVIRP